jgi:hypothetical protein
MVRMRSGADGPMVEVGAAELIRESLDVGVYNSAAAATSDADWLIVWDETTERAQVYGSGTYTTSPAGSNRGIIIQPPDGYEWGRTGEEDPEPVPRGVGTSWQAGGGFGAGDFGTSSGSTVLLNIVDSTVATADVVYRWSTAFTVYMRPEA